MSSGFSIQMEQILSFLGDWRECATNTSFVAEEKHVFFTQKDEQMGHFFCAKSCNTFAKKKKPELQMHRVWDLGLPEMLRGAGALTDCNPGSAPGAPEEDAPQLHPYLLGINMKT